MISYRGTGYAKSHFVPKTAARIEESVSETETGIVRVYHTAVTENITMLGM